MPTGKRILLLILSPILPLLLFGLALDYGVVKTVGNAGSVKQVLKDSGLYSSIIPSLLKQSGPIETSVGSISTQDPLVSDAVSKAVPPGVVQKNVEAAIDNIYAWLDGSTPQPTFNISLADSQPAFAKNLADEVQQKLAVLPTCTTAYTVSSFDALNATCLPRGLSPAAASQQLQADLNSGGLDQANLSATDLKGNAPGTSVFSDQWKNAPKQYQELKRTPLILTIATILVAAALVWLRPTWQGGLKHVGLSVLVVGLMMLVFSWAFEAALTKHVIPKIKLNDNAALQKNLQDGLTGLSTKLEHNYWLFGGIYTAAGAVMFAAPIVYGRRKTGGTLTEVVEKTPAKKG